MVSFIIPLYNRPEELSELLASFVEQKAQFGSLPYEIIVVEDGSSISSESVIKSYQQALPIVYLTQKNSGPAGARNYGSTQARGEWLIFLDSDTLIPEGYPRAIQTVIEEDNVDIFGGPDKGHPSFSPIQKGISYSMTSLLTTGGIRGGKSGDEGADLFYPRSYNLGIRTQLYRELNGFDGTMRYGEDLDLSMRAIKFGARHRLVKDAWVYHKRRTDYNSFFKQVMHSGEARWHLEKKHPGTLKLVHWFPLLFSLGLVGAFLFNGLFCLYFIYALLILLDAIINYHYKPYEAVQAVATSFVQHFGYGYGFLKGYLNYK